MVKKYPKKRFKKRRYKKKRKLTPNLTISRWGPMASRHRCRLKYTDTISMSSSIFPIHAMNANSIWDPDRTGIGHSCLAYGELSAFYNRYIVLNATCTVKFASASAQGTCALTAVNSNNTPATWDAFVEAPRSKTSFLPISGTQSNGRTLKVSCNLNKLYGRYGIQDDRVQAEMGSNPAESALFVMALQHIDGGSTTISCFAEVVVVYDVVLFDQKVISH